MKQDKFDEFYMLQTQAKGLEKRKKNSEALTIYLNILNNYFPDTDFSFRRAIELLQSFDRKDEVEPLINLAIERIKAKEMRGDITYFQALKLKAKKDEKANSEFNPNRFKNLDIKRIGFWTIYSIAAIIFSLPLKIYKFAFIILVAIILRLIIEITRRIKLSFSINRQIVLLLISLILGAFAAAQLPPPEWTSFFSLAPLANIARGTSVTITTHSQSSINSQTDADAALSDDDLTTLSTVYQDNLVLNSYDITVDKNTLTLTMFVKDTASDGEIKATAKNILTELNHIKGSKSYEDRLGDLYKSYQAIILVYESQQKLRLKGKTNKYTLKIKWQ